MLGIFRHLLDIMHVCKFHISHGSMKASANSPDTAFYKIYSVVDVLFTVLILRTSFAPTQSLLVQSDFWFCDPHLFHGTILSQLSKSCYWSCCIIFSRSFWFWSISLIHFSLSILVVFLACFEPLALKFSHYISNLQPHYIAVQSFSFLVLCKYSLTPQRLAPFGSLQRFTSDFARTSLPCQFSAVPNPPYFLLFYYTTAHSRFLL